MRILKDGHPILKKAAKPIENITEEHRKLAAEMMAAMHLAQGVGLAAPQVGHSIRLIVFDVVSVTMNSFDSGFMFNPEIVKYSGVNASDKEGCLSFPNRWIDIDRDTEITVNYVDIAGSARTEVFKGVAARVIQHEIDHLNGKVITDYER